MQNAPRNKVPVRVTLCTVCVQRRKAADRASFGSVVGVPQRIHAGGAVPAQQQRPAQRTVVLLLPAPRAGRRHHVAARGKHGGQKQQRTDQCSSHVHQLRGAIFSSGSCDPVHRPCQQARSLPAARGHLLQSGTKLANDLRLDNQITETRPNCYEPLFQRYGTGLPPRTLRSELRGLGPGYKKDDARTSRSRKSSICKHLSANEGCPAPPRGARRAGYRDQPGVASRPVASCTAMRNSTCRCGAGSSGVRVSGISDRSSSTPRRHSVCSHSAPCSSMG